MATEASRLRAFLAVELPPAVHERLAALTDELAQHGADVRWVRTANRHVTIKFLGSVAPPALAMLQDGLTPVLHAIAPLPARVRGLGAFPSWRRPRVLWAGIDCAPLPAVAAAVDQAAAQLGLAAETRPFTAHVTLGRVTGTRRWAALEAALRPHLADEFGAWTIDALTAFRSDLRPAGALYTRLWSIPFGA